MSNKTSLWTKIFILLMLANAFSFFAFDILLPTLPLFLSNQSGFNTSQIGLVIGSFTFSAVFIRFFTEIFTSRFGRKKVLVTSILICLISTLGYYIANSFYLALSLRIFHGFGLGLSITILTTLAAEIIPNERRGEGIGMIGNGTTIALAISPFVGLWLINSYDPIILFITAGASVLLFLVCVSFISFPENQKSENQKDQALLQQIIDPSAIIPSFLILLMGVCMGGVMSFMALYAKELNIEGVAWFYFINTISAFLIRFISGKTFDRIGPVWVIVPSTISMIIGFILLYQSTTLYGLLSAACLYGMGQGALFPALQAWVLNKTTPDRYLKVTSMFYNSLDIGIGGGSAILGLVAAKINYSTIYLVSAFIMLAFLIVYSSSLFVNKKKAMTSF
ncbi:MFS transporter [Bacillus sp. FJAT-49732]|uniref:MFS transporter n=1 Tax=Lederbergia citrisecunda TaxID=2833583 RepID=A0A942TQP6_9BACI|nr:MFS transporter [Lederbergia citrisecunda]MBS4201593.1 MFS transporter [Lederbergia citrisecunda]